jgi:hypothetical protein
MRPDRPLPSFGSSRILPVSILLFTAFSASAAIEHRAKADGTLLFGNPLLEPPPVASLKEGSPLQLLKQEEGSSQVRLKNGLRGWVRNDEIVAVKLAEGGDHRLGDQSIIGDDWNHTEVLLDLKAPEIRVDAIGRSFDAEVLETLDREQVEMKHDEN